MTNGEKVQNNIAVAANVFLRSNGRWVAPYIHEGKRKFAYGKTEEAAISRRQEIMNQLNNTAFSDKQTVNSIQLPDAIEHVSHNSTLNKNSKGINSTIYETNSNENSMNMQGNIVSCMTLGEWLTTWLEAYIKPNKGLATYSCYEVFANRHIIPRLGEIELQLLTTEMLQMFFDEKALTGRLDNKAGGMAPKSIQTMRYMLSSALCSAVSSGLIKENIVADIVTQKVIKKEVMTLSSEEEARLVFACNRYENISAFGIVIALRAGLHIGELLALKWSDIDINKKNIYVCNSLIRRQIDKKTANVKSELQFTKSKTERIMQECDLDESFFRDMESFMIRQSKGYGSIPDIVVASRNGGLVDPGNYNKLFKRILHKAGIPNAHFEILRNTYGLRYLEQGNDPSRLPKVMGCGDSSKLISRIMRLYVKQLERGIINNWHDY